MAFEKGYALVIGVGSYRYVPQADIPISVADAKRVSALLGDPNLCGYRPEHIALLHDDRAGREGIVNALDKLANQTTAEDTVLLYYCGHGDYGTDGNYYLTTHDTRVSGGRVVKGTGLGEAELLAKLRAIPAGRLLLLFNACHSGEISPDLGLGEGDKSFGGDISLPPTAAEALLSSGQGRIIISACRPEQKSWLGSGPLSIFTQALVDGLSGQGYVPNNNGYVSAFGLYEHMYLSIKEAAAKLGKTQEPELTVLKGVGPFPVSLYRGATELGAFDGHEPLPAGTAAREVDPVRSQRLFEGQIKTVTASGERAVAAGRDIRDSLINTGDWLTLFDQRGQRVQYQYNATGDINFGAAQSRMDALAELQKLQAEVDQAMQAGALDEEAATDADYQLKKAVLQAQKPDPDRTTILDHLAQAKDIIAGVAENVAAAAGLVAAVDQAIQMVQKLF
jgi:hypothetical protein